MASTHATDRAIALALDQRQQSEEDALAQQLFDESLARTLQDEEIGQTESGTQHTSTGFARCMIDFRSAAHAKRLRLRRDFVHFCGPSSGRPAYAVPTPPITALVARER